MNMRRSLAAYRDLYLRPTFHPSSPQRLQLMPKPHDELSPFTNVYRKSYPFHQNLLTHSHDGRYRLEFRGA